MDGINPKTLLLVNLLGNLVVIQELNDNLKGTKAYSQKLKHHSKGLEQEVDKILDQKLAIAYRAGDNGEETMVNIQRNKEELINTLCDLSLKLPPDDFVDVNQIIQLFLKDRERFKEVFTPVIVKIDDKWDLTPNLKPKQNNSEDSTI